MNRKAYPIFVLLIWLLLSCGGGGGGDSSPTAPSAPVNLVSISGNAQVRLSWENVNGATEYNIYWSTTSGAVKKTGTKISNVTSPHYQQGLDNGTIYYYVVTAANQYGESAESFEVSAMPSQVSPPLPPKEVAAFGFNKKTIVRWTAADASEGNITQNLYWSTLSGVKKGSGTKIEGAVAPYTHGDLTNGVTYYYVVTSVNAYGESAESQEVSAKPDQGNVPSAPTGVKAVAGDRQAVISWDMIEKEATVTSKTTYNIYWSTSSDVSSSNGTRIDDVESPYTHAGLTQGETYHYVVTAENGYGESDDSPKVSVTISDTRQDVCMAMGDSITEGDGASSYANSYVPLLSARWGKTVLNVAEGGAYSSDGAATIDVLLYQHNPRYLTIFFGTNDAGLMDPAYSIYYLQYMIQRAKENGTIPVIATLGACFDEWDWRKPYMIDLSKRIRQLAADEGIACADIEPALGWNRSYYADSLHPNNAGHQIIADTFYKALTQ